MSEDAVGLWPALGGRGGVWDPGACAPSSDLLVAAPVGDSTWSAECRLGQLPSSLREEKALGSTSGERLGADSSTVAMLPLGRKGPPACCPPPATNGAAAGAPAVPGCMGFRVTRHTTLSLTLTPPAWPGRRLGEGAVVGVAALPPADDGVPKDRLVGWLSVALPTDLCEGLFLSKAASAPCRADLSLPGVPTLPFPLPSLQPLSLPTGVAWRLAKGGGPYSRMSGLGANRSDLLPAASSGSGLLEAVALCLSALWLR